MMRRWLISALILLLMPITCTAEENGGSIRLTMSYDGAAVAGGTVTLYDVSDGPEEIGPEEMIVYVKELGISGTELAVDRSGQVLFADLQPGRYLLVQQKAAEGYYPMNPFLVRLSFDGEEMDAFPKLEPEKKLPQTGQLVWPAWGLLGLGAGFVGIGLFSRKRE